MKRIKTLLGFVFLLFGAIILASCGNKNKDDVKLPENNYEKVTFAFNGVEKSLNKETKNNSLSQSINLNNISINDNGTILDDIFTIFTSEDNKGDKAAEIEYSEPPLIQFRVLKSLIEKSGSDFGFGTKYFKDFQGTCYIDLTTGYKDDDQNIENKLDYIFRLSMKVDIKENDLISCDISFNLDLTQNNQTSQTKWYVHMDLDYDMKNATPNYTLTMVTANDQDELDYRLGYAYEYDYVEVRNNNIYEWRKFVLEADTKLIKDSNHQNMDSYLDNGVSINADTCKWYKNSNLYKMTTKTQEKQNTLSKKYFNLGLNSTNIDGEDFFNLNGIENNTIETVITEYKNNTNTDLIYSIICKKDGSKEEQEPDNFEYTMIKFYVVDSNDDLIIENGYPVSFDHRRLNTADITLSNTFKNDNIWSGSSPTYYDIFLIKKDGVTAEKADKSVLTYKLVYNNTAIDISLNDKLSDIFEANNITKDENNFITFTLKASYPGHDEVIIGEATYEMDLSEQGQGGGEQEERVISGIRLKNSDNTGGYGTTTPYDDVTLAYWLTNDITNKVDGSESDTGFETFEAHPYVVYVDQNDDFMSYVDLTTTEYSVEFKIDDEFVTVASTLKFSDILALYGCDYYEVRVKIGNFYSDVTYIKLFDYNSEIHRNYFAMWPTSKFIEAGFDENLIPPQINVTYFVSEYDYEEGYKKYIAYAGTGSVSITISGQNDITTYYQTLEESGYVLKEQNPKSKVYVKALNNGTEYVCQIDAPNNNRCILSYYIREAKD